MKVLKAVGSALLIIAIVVGAPVLLVGLGVLPTVMGWSELRRWLTTPDSSGQVLLWVLTVIGWVAWALFTVCVVAEVANHASGHRLNIRLPGVKAGQQVVGGLVAAVFALSTLQGSSAVADTHTPPAAASTVAPLVVERAPAKGPVTPAEDTDTTQMRTHVHVVDAGEYLWLIAEQYYDDGAQFQRIAKANGIDPYVDLHVGQKLLIPGVGDRPVSEQTVIPATVTVGPGDSLWSFAEKYLGDGHRWPEIHRLNTDLISDPDLLDDGWVLKMPQPATKTKPAETKPAEMKVEEKSVEEQTPAPTKPVDKTPAEVKTTPPATVPTTTEAPTHTPTTTTQAETTAQAETSERSGVTIPLAMSGVGLLLTAGLITTLNRRRRRQLAQRVPGQKITLPAEPSQRVETALRAQEPAETVQALDTILRVIGEHHHHKGLALPRLTAARLAADRIDLLLAEPALDAPEGVELVADGAVWTIHADRLAVFTDRAEDVAGVNAPWPALVTLGRDDDGANILLDLEAAAALVITTEDHDTAHALLRGLALDLAVAPWAAELNLTLVGQVCPHLELAMGEPTITRVGDVEELLTSLEARAQLQREVMSESTATHIGQVRIDPNAADLADPEIILLDQALDPQTAARLAAVLSDLPRAAVATVTTAPVDVAEAWRFQLAGDPLVGRLRPHDWKLNPQTVDTDTYLAVLDCLQTSRQVDTEPAPWWNHNELDSSPQDSTTAAVDSVPAVASIATLPTVGLTKVKPAAAEPAGQKRAPLSLAPLLGDVDLATIYTDEPAAEPVEPEVDLAPAPPVEPLADPDTIADVRFLHPTLRVLGPVELVGARGEYTSSGKIGALEILMYLLDHPGTSAKDLADAVMISVSTARPKITHLRSWLGQDPETGEEYLPKGSAAGGYRLTNVTSDWHALQNLIAGGVNRCSTTNLVKALKLVRGTPFDASSRGFAFAEAIRVDMVSTITDIALQLVDQALDRNDTTLARWACSRALVVDPESEALLAARIRTEYHAGNATEVDRLISRVNHNARALDVDLRDSTVEIIQRAGAL